MHTCSTSLGKLLVEYVPENALEYCIALWSEQPFTFKVSNNRISKLGDYKFDPRVGEHAISVNGGLNQYAFLVTFLHEFAHLLVQIRFNSRQRPHGQEWKNCFNEVMAPVLQNDVFPSPLKEVLAKHMENPRASSGSDPELYAALKVHDDVSGVNMLMDLPNGVEFVFKNRVFQKVKHKRTRVLCNEVGSGRQYLIPAIVEIDIQ